MIDAINRLPGTFWVCILTYWYGTEYAWHRYTRRSASVVRGNGDEMILNKTF
jgi:hypothetical protein